MSRINGKLGQKCCCADFVSVCHPWTCWLQKGILKKELSSIQLTTYFGDNNFWNIWSMKLLIFLKIHKVLCRFQKCKKNKKMFLLLEIITSEPVAGIYLNYDENTCDRKSTCYLIVLRLQIWLREIFSSSICLGLMEN